MGQGPSGANGRGIGGDAGGANDDDGQPQGSGLGEPVDQTEAEIVAAMQQQDFRLALVLCVRAYGELLGRLCMSLVGSQVEAEDLTQETLVDAYAGLSKWRGEGSVRAWLCAIARRKCARQLEKRGRQRAKLRLVVDRGDNDQTEQLVLKRQRAEQARGALNNIRPSERDALLLRYGAGLSFREVGQACGIDEVAARKRVSRGVSALREKLQEEGLKP